MFLVQGHRGTADGKKTSSPIACVSPPDRGEMGNRGKDGAGFRGRLGGKWMHWRRPAGAGPVDVEGVCSAVSRARSSSSCGQGVAGSDPSWASAEGEMRGSRRSGYGEAWAHKVGSRRMRGERRALGRGLTGGESCGHRSTGV